MNSAAQVAQLPDWNAIKSELGILGEHLLNRLAADSYGRFVDALHVDIEAVLQGMERDRERHYKKSEDQLTHFIASMLAEKGYTCSAGRQQSGSVDLTVERRTKGYIWTAEAKIFTSLSKVEEGFLQLTTRYSPGDFEDAHTGILIYVQAGDAASKLSSWRAHVAAKPGTKIVDSASRKNLSFSSIQTHETSGLDFTVKHWAVALLFRPRDASGRNAKRYK